MVQNNTNTNKLKILIIVLIVFLSIILIVKANKKDKIEYTTNYNEEVSQSILTIDSNIRNALNAQSETPPTLEEYNTYIANASNEIENLKTLKASPELEDEAKQLNSSIEELETYIATIATYNESTFTNKALLLETLAKYEVLKNDIDKKIITTNYESLKIED